MELKKQRAPTKTKDHPIVELDENGEELIVTPANQLAKITTNSIMQSANTQMETQVAESQQQLNKLRRNKIEEKRVFIIDSEMKEMKPFLFEVDRGDGEKQRVMYSKSNDKFFQIQESLSEYSTFVGKAIMKETKLYIVAEIDPIFFMIRPLRIGILPNQKLYQTLSQILDAIFNIQSEDHNVISTEFRNPYTIGLENNSFHYNAMYNDSTLKELLLKSQRVRNALTQICAIKTISLSEEEQMITYCYDEEKLISHLLDKHSKIKKHLAKKQGSILVKQVQPQIIKQEKKRGKPNQDVKMEESKNDDEDFKEYEHLFETIAAGFVADELPKDLVGKFLEAVQIQKEKVFMSADGKVHNDENQYKNNNMIGGQIDKKRSMTDTNIQANGVDKQNTMIEQKNQNSNLKKKQTAKEPVKSGPLNNFFKPKQPQQQ